VRSPPPHRFPNLCISADTIELYFVCESDSFLIFLFTSENSTAAHLNPTHRVPKLTGFVSSASPTTVAILSCFLFLSQKTVPDRDLQSFFGRRPPRTVADHSPVLLILSGTLRPGAQLVNYMYGSIQIVAFVTA